MPACTHLEFEWVLMHSSRKGINCTGAMLIDLRTGENRGNFVKQLQTQSAHSGQFEMIDAQLCSAVNIQHVDVT